MADPNWTQAVTAVAAIISALATCGTAGIALYAALTWRNALKSQRADECLAAIRGLMGSIDRCLRVKVKENLTDMAPIWRAYDEVWAAWRRFDQAFWSLGRYYPSLDKSIPTMIAHEIEELADWLLHNWGDHETLGWQGGHDVRKKIEHWLKALDTL